MIANARLHRHRPGRARGCSKNRAPPFALRARSVFPAAWAGQRNLRSSRTRDFKSSASTVVSIGMRKNKREVLICHVEVAAVTLPLVHQECARSKIAAKRHDSPN